WITSAELRFDGQHAIRSALDDSSRNVFGQTITFPRRTFHRLDITVKAVSDRRTNLFGHDDSVGFAEIRLRDDHSDHDVSAHEIIQMPTDIVDALGPAVESHPL